MTASIPHVLHQTWKSAEVPAQWRLAYESWATMLPGWERRLWTDAENRQFVEAHYPSLLRTYDGYRYAIQRADAVRYCLLHHFGGVYVDLDLECLRPLDDLVEGVEGILVPEPAEQASQFGRATMLSNAFMAFRPKHPLMLAVIEHLSSDTRGGISHIDVLETTGPLMLSDVFARHGSEGVTVLPAEVAFPLRAHSREATTLQNRTEGFEAIRNDAIARGAYAVHYWANSWVGTLAGELHNPTPDRVPGYCFYRGLDSPGNDISNVGRDIQQAAIACSAIEGALGFNTDGFVKGRLLSREHWQPMGNGAPDEGLYVRQRPGLLRRLLSSILHR